MRIQGPALKTLWLNDFEDPSDRRSFPFMTSFKRNEEIKGERRVYGTGRLRSYSQAGETHDWDISIKALTPDDAAWLSRHKDRVLIARDDRGHRIFGTYWALPFEENSYNEESSVSLRFMELTETLVV